ncbi:MAG: 30S ribosomal protein S10 [bacterium]|uniref:Small ribosomal subunit protein uS10 n=1 Tax=candidate division WOR-3 bacterium TaxID=2052148 RepID=A0A348MIL6_UNCW3|nr:MAG: 30S ribosomal protein S10 [candidate division TA06 bacterium 32_111]MDI6700060.1 30S ribosomal protein S10 [bacterium]HAF06892.1 30S ribosomal protein S10 [candidate division WOR-3 bacterium]HCP15949.1 30S ribosomal protein S10 [candidate division WOR-3 bacterium]
MVAKKIDYKIKLKSYDHQLLDQAAKDIVKTAKKTNAELIGPIPLPTKRSIYTVNRSTNVDKKSREQFEIRVHKRAIFVSKSTPQTMEALTRLDIPAGVDIEIVTFEN